VGLLKFMYDLPNMPDEYYVIIKQSRKLSWLDSKNNLKDNFPTKEELEMFKSYLTAYIEVQKNVSPLSLMISCIAALNTIFLGFIQFLAKIDESLNDQVVFTMYILFMFVIVISLCYGVSAIIKHDRLSNSLVLIGIVECLIKEKDSKSRLEKIESDLGLAKILLESLEKNHTHYKAGVVND